MCGVAWIQESGTGTPPPPTQSDTSFTSPHASVLLTAGRPLTAPKTLSYQNHSPCFLFWDFEVDNDPGWIHEERRWWHKYAAQPPSLLAAASRLAQQQQQQQQQQRVLAGLTESRGRKVESPAATSTAGTTHIAQNNTGHNTDCAEHTTYTTHSDTHWTEWLESGGRSIAAVDQLSCVCRGSNKTQLTRKHKTTTKTRKYKNNNTEHKHTCLHWDAGLVAVGGKTRFLEVLSVVLCCNEMIAF